MIVGQQWYSDAYHNQGYGKQRRRIIPLIYQWRILNLNNDELWRITSFGC